MPSTPAIHDDMLSDQTLIRLLRSERLVRRDGGAIRLVVAGLVFAILAALTMYYAVLVRTMASDTFRFNDFGKFYYSARMFLDGEDMYGPSPATTMPVGGSAVRPFLNMNPPHFHLLLLPLAMLPLQTAAIIWAFASALALAYSLRVVFSELGFHSTPAQGIWLLLAIFAFSATATTLLTGQVSLLLLPLVTHAWRAARRDRWAMAGALLGVLISIKPFLLIFLPWFVLTRRWRAAAAAALAIAAAYVVGVAVFGMAAHAAWVRALDATNWTWAAMNGSTMGLVSRAFGQSPYYAPLSHLPSVVTPLWLASALVIAGVSVLAASFDRSSESVDRAFFLLLMGSFLASPLGWVYYLWLPVPAAIALVLNARRRRAQTNARVRGRNLLLWLAVPGLVWPLPLILAGQPNPLATVTIGSIYFWTTFFLWCAAFVDGWAERCYQPAYTIRDFVRPNTRSR